MTIQEFGFKLAGKCWLDDGLKSGVRFDIEDSFAKERVIYAFVVQQADVKYIGICEAPIMTLSKRMNDYQGMAADSERKNVEHIRQCLKASQVVEIWAWNPERSGYSFSFMGIQVDLIKGLENPLIQKFQPKWNNRNKWTVSH